MIRLALMQAGFGLLCALFPGLFYILQQETTQKKESVQGQESTHEQETIPDRESIQKQKSAQEQESTLEQEAIAYWIQRFLSWEWYWRGLSGPSQDPALTDGFDVDIYEHLEHSPDIAARLGGRGFPTYPGNSHWVISEEFSFILGLDFSQGECPFYSVTGGPGKVDEFLRESGNPNPQATMSIRVGMEFLPSKSDFGDAGVLEAMVAEVLHLLAESTKVKERVQPASCRQPLVISPFFRRCSATSYHYFPDLDVLVKARPGVGAEVFRLWHPARHYLGSRFFEKLDAIGLRTEIDLPPELCRDSRRE